MVICFVPPLDEKEGTEYPEAARTPMMAAKVMMATRSASILRDLLRGRGWCVGQQWPSGDGGALPWETRQRSLRRLCRGDHR